MYLMGGFCNGLTIVDDRPNVLVQFPNSTTFTDSLGLAISTDNSGTSWTGNLDKLDFGGSDIYGGLIHQFDSQIWVTTVIQDALDSLVYIVSPDSSPLAFSTKELVKDTSGFFITHELNSVCGELAVVFQYAKYFYIRTDTGLTYYEDLDNDSFGNPNISMQSSIPISGYVLNNTDCDDNDPLITHPGSPCNDNNPCTSGSTLQADCSCGAPSNINTTINTYIGSNATWMNPNNWSLNLIPEICHDVIIPSGKTVRINANENGICFTLFMHSSAVFDVDTNGGLEVVTLGN